LHTKMLFSQETVSEALTPGSLPCGYGTGVSNGLQTVVIVLGDDFNYVDQGSFSGLFQLKVLMLLGG
jgi:hypothetical protein